MKARIREVIVTAERRGSGVEGDPVRLVHQLWTKGGRLIAEKDQLGTGFVSGDRLAILLETNEAGQLDDGAA